MPGDDLDARCMRPIDRLPAPLRAEVVVREGVVARRELLAAGLSLRTIRTIVADSTVVVPGVYDLTGDDVPWPRRGLTQRLWCGALHAGERSVVDGVSALLLHGVEGPVPSAVLLAVPAACSVSSRGGIRVERRGVLPMTTRRSGLIVADVPDAVLRAAHTRRDALTWVTAACQQRVTTAARVLARLRDRARHPQRAFLEALLVDIEAGATTALEVAYRRDVVLAHGLPSGVAQFRVPGTGRIADAGYEAERLLVELDSIAHHSGADRFGDLTRDVVHLIDGWATLRFGDQQVSLEACDSAARLRDVLVARGGRPTFHPCPRCRAADDVCSVSP